MAKKLKYSKLGPKNSNTQSPTPANSSKSAFSNHSQRIQKAKQKKIEKLNDTRNRLLAKKKQNKHMKIPSSRLSMGKGHRINKFSLLDDDNNNNNNESINVNKLTHKGKTFDQVRNFDDVDFKGDEDMDGSNFDDMHDEVNFHGFDDEAEGDGEDRRGGKEGQRKSKNEIYKQIIQKSKLHKRDRQEQYEQNLQAAIQLDEQFPDFVSKLKFRNNDAKVRQKIQKRDLQYQRLMNQLRQDERVVANRVVDNTKKGVEKIKKKKHEQLKELMAGSDGEEQEDIRGWVKNLEDGDEEGEEGEEDLGSGEGDENEEDQIDDVELSSGELQDEEQQEAEQDYQQDNSEEQSQEPAPSPKYIIQNNSSSSEQQLPQKAQKNNKFKQIQKPQSKLQMQSKVQVQQSKNDNKKNKNCRR